MLGENPYIRQLHLDSKEHLWIDYSDGRCFDLGYLPTGSIDIHVRKENENEHNQGK